MESTRTDYPVALPNGDVKQARHDATGTALCGTCGSVATYHLFRPAIGVRCVACCETYGTAPTHTDPVTLTVTLSDDTHTAHPVIATLS